MEYLPSVSTKKKTVPFVKNNKRNDKSHTELLKEAFYALELYEVPQLFK